MTASASRSLLALSLILPLSTGCGDGRPKVYPVSGVVLIDGQPLTAGTIQVTPKDMRPALGKIGSDGRFTLTTFETNDGCPSGTHPVVVSGIEWLSDVQRRWHAPKKYANASTSGLTATIDGPADVLKIELTWDGPAAPFTERVE